MTASDTEQTTTISIDTTVDAPIEHAFRLFTEGIGSWWDKDHHLLDSEIQTMTFEPREGGHIIDRYVDGRECAWSRVLTYDPPKRVVFSWDITLDWKPSTDYERSSEVDVTFTRIDADRTHVVLTHRNLDRHGEGWEAMRDGVSRGWSLADFARVASQR
jgi:uncharacterized protein YndB with AHSA1/START domain